MVAITEAKRAADPRRWHPVSPAEVLRDIRHYPEGEEFLNTFEAFRKKVHSDGLHTHAYQLFIRETALFNSAILLTVKSSDLYRSQTHQAFGEVSNSFSRQVGAELQTGKREGRDTQLRLAYEHIGGQFGRLVTLLPDELIEKYVGKFEHPDPENPKKMTTGHDEYIRKSAAKETLLIQLLETHDAQYIFPRRPCTHAVRLPGVSYQIEDVIMKGPDETIKHARAQEIQEAPPDEEIAVG